MFTQINSQGEQIADGIGHIGRARQEVQGLHQLRGGTRQRNDADGSQARLPRSARQQCIDYQHVTGSPKATRQIVDGESGKVPIGHSGSPTVYHGSRPQRIGYAEQQQRARPEEQVEQAADKQQAE